MDIIHIEEVLLSGFSDGLVWFMIFNATFNNISVRSVLLVEETRGPGENH
jgi:hypothetical protein